MRRKCHNSKKRLSNCVFSYCCICTWLCAPRLPCQPLAAVVILVIVLVVAVIVVIVVFVISDRPACRCRFGDKCTLTGSVRSYSSLEAVPLRTGVASWDPCTFSWAFLKGTLKRCRYPGADTVNHQQFRQLADTQNYDHN